MAFIKDVKTFEKNYNKRIKRNTEEKKLLDNIRNAVISFGTTDEEIKSLFDSCLNQIEKTKNNKLCRLATKNINKKSKLTNFQLEILIEIYAFALFGGALRAFNNALYTGIEEAVGFAVPFYSGLIIAWAAVSEYHTKKISKKIVLNNKNKLSFLNDSAKVIKNTAKDFKDLEL